MLLSKGAEAEISVEDGRVIKHRVSKRYRHPLLDTHLRKTRTRREATLLRKAAEAGVPVPKVIHVDEGTYTLVMEYIDGPKLRDVLNGENIHLMREVGTLVARLHAANLVHGDLTTSNMIVADKIYFIDFGLGEVTHSIEDKAVDIVCFKKSFFATHSDVLPEAWDEFLAGYATYPDHSKVLRRAEEVEKRARYL